MKIAIPYAEEQVFQHFNEASQFKINTVDEFDILEEELVSISQDTYILWHVKIEKLKR